MRDVRFILIFIVLLGLLLPACSSSPGRPAQVTYEAVEGEQAQRVEIISSMLERLHPLPTALIDAHFVEEKRGDGMLGPSDYRTFARLIVPPEQIAEWQAILVPLNGQPAYAAPAQPTDWWVDKAGLPALTFYEPAPLTGRSNGWIAIDNQNGIIYLYSYTT
jgi:hypothetical protein